MDSDQPRRWDKPRRDENAERSRWVRARRGWPANYVEEMALFATRTAWIALVILLGAAAGSPAVAGESKFIEYPSLEFTRIDLNDGRRLRDVVVKSYNVTTRRLFLVSQGVAMSVPLELIPAGVRAMFTAGPIKIESNSLRTIAPKKQAPAPVRRPAGTPRATNAPDPAIARERQLAQDAETHREVALGHAERYYRFEHQVGSSSIKVTALDFEAGTARPISGWPGRYRLEGRAFLEFFDSVGSSFQRTTSRFDIVTEQQQDGELRVVSFDRK